MTTPTFSVYELATGRLTGAQVWVNTIELIESAVPEGCGVVLGAWDYWSFVVDIESGEVIPAAPSAPDWMDKKANAASAAYGEILQAEAEQARPMRELVQALLAGMTPEAETVARFAEIAGRIEAARAHYNAVLATTTEAALDAVMSA
jgi:hypothetical protein